MNEATNKLENRSDIKRFDMSLPPRKTKWYLKPLKKILCAGDLKKHQPKITYVGTENLKAPFLLLCNHNAFFDFKVATKVLGKNDANFVVAIDGFLHRESLLRNVGCICKRKFTNDITLIKQLKRVINMGNVAAIYPEARYSLCGTTAILPSSLGKLVKLLNVPLVTLICHGHHINSPFWDTSHDRGVVGTEATYKLLMNVDEIKEKSADEINEQIVNEFQYDDFKWQQEHHIIIDEENRADGLEKVLYQCPHCKSEHDMISKGEKLVCQHCHKEWELTPDGFIKAIDGETEFSHIPDWYEWERENVRKEVEEGTYSTGILKVHTDSLPKDSFIPLGEGTLVHDMEGFKLIGENNSYEMIKSVESMYSCHIEYRYLFKHGDCIDLNTLTDTYYIYPEEGQKFNVTKIALATEELYKNNLKKKGIEVKKGLA